ncbi:MAG: M48 family metallopeptidase [Deltaproteobacteria bacterium]|nr:M48 family metallopeptidase [Deltaproteobacteria bacterium]
MVQFNLLLFAFLAFFILRSLTQILLSRLNIAHLRRSGGSIPDVFQDAIDPEKLKKISAYTADSSRFGILSTLASQAFTLLLLLSGLLPWLVHHLHRPGWGMIPSGLAFFASLGVLTNLFQIPFDLYDTFVIENRYGFNTKTFRVWVMDLLKSLALSALLGGFLLWLLLSLISGSGKFWWVGAWMLVGAFELLLLWLYPVILAPLFNKFEPLADTELVRRIAKLMERAGLKARGIFQMDASKRSRHTNAYFTGLGKSKRIVLFDTLLQSHTADEIEAVLAHEIGHWKKKHILKQLLVMELLSLIAFYVVAQLLNWPLLYRTFGFSEPVSYVGLLLIGALFSPLGYFVQPLGSVFSRKFEREADDYALGLIPSGEPLIQAFKRLAADNLANLTPHPLYAWFYYSHPPLVERILRLKKAT